MIKQFVDTYFINDKLKEVPYVYSKARVLAYAHLFAFSLSILLFITGFINGFNEDVPLLEGATIFVALAIFFRFKGDLIISGNLLAGIIFGILFSAVQTTGGLYSDNLLWMLLTPIVALLFANRLSSVLWTVALVVATLFLYQKEIPNIEAGNKFTLLFGADYYAISYVSFFIAIVFFVHIFEKGRESLTKKLVAKNKELKGSRAQLKNQHEQLVTQKEELVLLSKNLKQSNTDLEHFAHAASHDLKQPLRMIKSYVQLINVKDGHKLDEESQEWIQFISKGSIQMERLLSDLLSLSRLGQKNPPSERINLNDVILLIRNNLRMKIGETNAAIIHADLPTIYAPKSLISQLFQNLISNAIKFQKPNTRPIITIEAKFFNGEVVVSIKDNGIGIAEEHQEKIFNIFRRLHTQEEYEGSGIGLHTCKRIIDSMNKKIWLESEAGVGTTFYITLPEFVEEMEISETTVPANEIEKRNIPQQSSLLK